MGGGDDGGKCWWVGKTGRTALQEGTALTSRHGAAGQSQADTTATHADYLGLCVCERREERG